MTSVIEYNFNNSGLISSCQLWLWLVVCSVECCLRVHFQFWNVLEITGSVVVHSYHGYPAA